MVRKGSFTVEAAMLMGIILFVILSVLSCARMVYNRTIILAHSYETAISKRAKDLDVLWGMEEYDISIEIEELEPVSYLWKSQWWKSEVLE